MRRRGPAIELEADGSLLVTSTNMWDSTGALASANVRVSGNTNPRTSGNGIPAHWGLTDNPVNKSTSTNKERMPSIEENPAQPDSFRRTTEFFSRNGSQGGTDPNITDSNITDSLNTDSIVTSPATKNAVEGVDANSNGSGTQNTETQNTDVAPEEDARVQEDRYFH